MLFVLVGIAGVALGDANAQVARRARAEVLGTKRRSGPPRSIETAVDSAEGVRGIILRKDIMDGPAGSRIRAFDPKTPTERIVVAPGISGMRHSSGTPLCSGDLVYRNNLGQVFFPPGPGVLMADDIQTVCVGGGNMTCYEMLLFGGGDGSGPGFSATVQLWDGCPGDGGTAIPDTAVTWDFEDDGAFVLTVDFEGEPLAVSNEFWISAEFNNDTAGWVFGTEPTLGFSEDLFYLDDPAVECIAWFGGCGSGTGCANFEADVYFEACEAQHLSYESVAFSGLFYGGTANEVSADDIVTVTPNCQLVRMELEYGGLPDGETPHPYTAHISIFGDAATDPPNPDATNILVDGLTFDGAGNGFIEQAVFEFNPPVSLPEKFWVTNMDDHGDAGPLIAGGPAILGQSEDLYALQDGNEWALQFFGGCNDGDGDACGSFNMRLFCGGSPPSGACCDASACTDDVQVQDCNGRFASGESCATAVFDPPCGQASCCLPDGSCNDLDETACDDAGGYRDETTSCGDVGFACPHVGCIGASGSCTLEHVTPGCSITACCGEVCAIDPFCCTQNWDITCADTANGMAQCLAPPDNDDCSDAFPLVAGTTPLSNDSATSDGPGLPVECDEGNGLGFGADVWFDYTASDCGMISVSTCNTADFDTRMSVYSGCDCPTSNDRLIGCNDDVLDCDLFTGTLEFAVEAGECYKIRVGGFNGVSGTGTLEVTEDFTNCPNGCPTATIAFLDPPDGVIDARAPHELNDDQALLGIDEFVVQADADVSDITCWTLCETAAGDEPNTVRASLDHGDGTYTLLLDRPITPAAVTTVTYGATGDVLTMTALPGNVDGNGVTDPMDILAIIDILNGVETAPFGLFSGDLDYSQQIGPSDILVVIDLLNGASAFDPWIDVSVPQNTCAP
jgi:hypothetical protein